MAFPWTSAMTGLAGTMLDRLRSPTQSTSSPYTAARTLLDRLPSPTTTQTASPVQTEGTTQAPTLVARNPYTGAPVNQPATAPATQAEPATMQPRTTTTPSIVAAPTQPQTNASQSTGWLPNMVGGAMQAASGIFGGTVDQDRMARVMHDTGYRLATGGQEPVYGGAEVPAETLIDPAAEPAPVLPAPEQPDVGQAPRGSAEASVYPAPTEAAPPPVPPPAEGATEEEQSEIDKLWADMMAQHEGEWSNIEELLSGEAAARRRRASAVNAEMGRSLGGSFLGGQRQADLSSQAALLQARLAHDEELDEWRRSGRDFEYGKEIEGIRAAGRAEELAALSPPTYEDVSGDFGAGVQYDSENEEYHVSGYPAGISISDNTGKWVESLNLDPRLSKHLMEKISDYIQEHDGAEPSREQMSRIAENLQTLDDEIREARKRADTSISDDELYDHWLEIASRENLLGSGWDVI